MGIILTKKERLLEYKGLKRETGLFVHECVFEYVTKYCDIDAKILDIGAGSGSFVRLLKEYGFSDVSAVEIDKTKFKESTKLFVLDLNSDFAEKIQEKFDCIVAIEVIEHLENPIHFLRECTKLLNPKGYLILSTPNIHSSISRAHHFLFGSLPFFNEQNYLNKFGHTYPLPFEFFKNIFNKMNLELIEYSSTKIPLILRFEYRPVKRFLNFLLALFLNFFLKKSELAGENLILVFQRL